VLVEKVRCTVFQEAELDFFSCVFSFSYSILVSAFILISFAVPIREIDVILLMDFFIHGNMNEICFIVR
jgi:hypothetical protein